MFVAVVAVISRFLSLTKIQFLGLLGRGMLQPDLLGSGLTGAWHARHITCGNHGLLGAWPAARKKQAKE